MLFSFRLLSIRSGFSFSWLCIRKDLPSCSLKKTQTLFLLNNFFKLSSCKNAPIILKKFNVFRNPRVICEHLLYGSFLLGRVDPIFTSRCLNIHKFKMFWSFGRFNLSLALGQNSPQKSRRDRGEDFFCSCGSFFMPLFVKQTVLSFAKVQDKCAETIDSACAEKEADLALFTQNSQRYSLLPAFGAVPARLAFTSPTKTTPEII